ncbi:hypothetical protein AXK56_07640 [Tsukamurella pulmonis]|uniref:Uncharacterized protein n=1 Tax=Tsukamurella pulmonis TaxID=47312 RepID=A0A1H1C942_9ACTN|nr:hypothetical protein [Tsukamurella pulmonis]KXO90004.1 hypothetical protein AXK56_07640 [Tsukamurella pulmonis]SDQ60715.1 hypothetical protein SAMN04489765_1087 [Tsukamurella pulmonis]SUP24034.1 Uncharacterised protein [Tsukamurella pulmonis]
MPDIDGVAKSGQEQAVAAWVDHLNRLRIDALLSSWGAQDDNLRASLASITDAMRAINSTIIDSNRGGLKGMHGFIAEAAEVGIGNARSRIIGGGAVYKWVNDNGPTDLVRSGVGIQQKFVAAGGRFGLGAIEEHLAKYPDYLDNGFKYQIPRDHYDAVIRLHSMSREEASLLTGGGSDPSFKQWERVQSFFERGTVTIDSIEPSHLDYAQAQRGTIETTLQAEADFLRTTDRAIRDDAYRQSRPSLRGGAAAAAAGAAAEGGMTFVLAVAAKRRERTRLRDFTTEDWVSVAGESGLGVTKGAVRGAAVYGLSNFTTTPAAAAGSMVTAAFGVADQANRLRRGEINEARFLENAELVCLETAVGAVSALAGQALIPVPVLGAVIGNTVGAVLYRTASSALAARERALIAQYEIEQKELDDRLDADHRAYVAALATAAIVFLDLLDRAFSPDVQTALLGSVELATLLGVPQDDILDTPEAAASYFLD